MDTEEIFLALCKDGPNHRYHVNIVNNTSYHLTKLRVVSGIKQLKNEHYIPISKTVKIFETLSSKQFINVGDWEFYSPELEIYYHVDFNIDNYLVEKHFRVNYYLSQLPELGEIPILKCQGRVLTAVEVE